MTNFKEQLGPNQEKNHLLEKATRKIAQTIKQENFKITPLVADRLKTAVNELGALDIETAPDTILISIIEQLVEAEGGFPGNLEDFYLKNLAQQLAREVTDDNPVYQILRAKAGDLKRRGVNLDGKKLQELIEKLIGRPWSQLLSPPIKKGARCQSV